MGFCSCTLKYILFFFNLAVALLGLAVVGVCIYANIHGKSLRSFLEGQINITSIVLLSVGALVFLIAFLGCCGAIRENHCYLITYGVILSALLLAEIVVGILCFVTVPKVQDEYSKYLDQTFDDALKDNQEAVNNMYGIQSNLECCGIMDANDYTSHGKEIPASCCKDRHANNSTCSAADAYQKGCKDAGNVTIKFFLLLMGIVAVIVATVELLCVIFAFCLASSIKRNQMRGYA